MPISNCPDVMSIDFETRSMVDLRKAGVNVYVEDPTTDVWCLSYGTKPNQIDTWVPDQYHPDALANHVATGGLVSGWNVAFELAVWNRILVPYYGFPALDHRQCIDTQAMAQARGFPAALGECADAMRLPVQKDKKGQALMMRMCRPRKVHEDGTLEWWDDQARVDALIAYCEQDVRTEMAVFNMLPRLSGSEQLQWELNYQINERGVPIDLKLLHGAMKIAHDEGMALNDELKALSKGAVSRVTEVAKLRAYLEWLGVLDLPESLDKSAVMALLARDDLSVLARRALEIRQEAGKSSLGKLKAMKARMNSDHRIRGTIKFHGASSTGRFSGAGIQIQNFPRDSVKPAAVLDLILDGDRDGVDLFASKGVLPTLSAALRNMITAPEGRVFGVIDYSQIESRATAWLANDFEKLDVFRQGRDIYQQVGAGMFGIPEDQVVGDLRQSAKTTELAAGFGGGPGALAAMAKNYNLDFDEDTCTDLVSRWRQANPKSVQLWKDLFSAALHAMQNPGLAVSTCGGRISYVKTGNSLRCRLPSGRVIVYPWARLEKKQAPWDKTQLIDAILYEGQITGKGWGERSLWRGLACENVVQALCSDLLREALLKLHRNGFEIVFHVHDEIVVEMDEVGSEGRFQLMMDLMTDVPLWAQGFPIDAEGHVVSRYSK